MLKTIFLVLILSALSCSSDTATQANPNNQTSTNNLTTTASNNTTNQNNTTGSNNATNTNNATITTATTSTVVPECVNNADCDAAPAALCLDNVLRSFTSVGTCENETCDYATVDTECGALGCCTDHCCDFAVSNEGDIGLIETTNKTIGASGIFNTDSDCTIDSALGECKPVAVFGETDLCVCRMDVLTITDLDIEGTSGLVILAAKTVEIKGAIKTIQQAAGLPGTSRTYQTPATTTSGGAGGSYQTIGGNGDPVFGTEELVPLSGGMSGQDSCNRQGGAGGGALQIVAGEKILVSGTINFGGAGGVGGSSMCVRGGGGAGGGSGGGILLEAPEVSVRGILAANGGGGGGGGSERSSGSTGFSGSTQQTGVAGGEGADGEGCALGGRTSGGDGGRGSMSDNPGSTGESSDSITSNCFENSYVAQGGSGGGAGRIRINTLTGCDCTGEISPPSTFGTLTAK